MDDHYTALCTRRSELTQKETLTVDESAELNAVTWGIDQIGLKSWAGQSETDPDATPEAPLWEQVREEESTPLDPDTLGE